MIRVYDFDAAEANDLINATLVVSKYVYNILLGYQYSTYAITINYKLIFYP